MEARTFAHAGVWIGLGITAYTNWQAAPVADLQVAYLGVPVMLAVASEVLIRSWTNTDKGFRLFLALINLALIATSYEHYRHMIIEAHGTAFSASVGAAVVDASIFACVLATCRLTKAPSSAEAPASTLRVELQPEPPVEDAPELRGASAPILHVEPPLELHAPEAPLSMEPPVEDGGFHSTMASSVEPPRSVAGSALRKVGASVEASLQQLEDLRRIREAFPTEAPRNVDIKNLIGCGDGKAGKLRSLHMEALERISGTTART